MRHGNRKPTGPHKWVIEQLPGCRKREIRRHKRQLRIHRRRADVVPLLEVVCRLGRTPGARDERAEVQRVRLAGVQGVVFEDAEVQRRVFHADRAVERHVGEGLDDAALRAAGARAAEGVEGEAERGCAVLRPFWGRESAYGGVKIGIAGSAAPELVDALGEYAAGYEVDGGIGGAEGDDTEG